MTTPTHDIAVFGAGSWGTALALSAARTGKRVVLWARRDDAVEAMRREGENREYLPGAPFPPTLTVTSDLDEAARSADLWLFATPSQAARGVAERLIPHVRPSVVAYSASKGIETGTLLTATEVLADVLPLGRARLGVLYGPSHAEEVARGAPTAIVAAGYDPAVASLVQAAFAAPMLRVYVHTDVLGVEIGGSVKNVLALAGGMSDGLGGGDNSKAALITRGIAEIRRLGVALGARPSTFAGLTGLGDLVVTCMSQHSRNRHLGERLGRGQSLESALASMTMVAEGVKTTQSAHDLAARHGVEMPITEAVYQILFEGKTCIEALAELMARAPKHEEWLPEEAAEVERAEGDVSALCPDVLVPRTS